MSQRTDTLAREMVSKREAFEKVETEAKRLKKIYEEAQAAFWEHLDDIGLKTATLDLGDGFGEIQFQRRETVRGNVKDHAKAVQSIREAGLEGELLTDPKIPQKPLNDNMRDWLASGQAIPEGLDFSVKRYVSVTRK